MLGSMVNVPDPPKLAAQLTSSAVRVVLPIPDTALLKLMVEVPARTVK